MHLFQQDQKLLKDISASSSQLDLESQLQDVRKTVAVMQVILVEFEFPTYCISSARKH